MTLLPIKASRPRFPGIQQAIYYYWASVVLTAIPVAAKPAVAAKAPIPASGNTPAVPTVAAVAPVPAKPGVPALLQFFTFEKSQIDTTLGFRLPLTPVSGLIAALTNKSLIRQIAPITTAPATAPAWDMGTGLYNIPDEPTWCATIEQMLAWLANQHTGTKITLVMAAQSLDFKVILSNDDLGAVSLLLGE
jgi:hypothetical protein